MLETPRSLLTNALENLLELASGSTPEGLLATIEQNIRHLDADHFTEISDVINLYSTQENQHIALRLIELVGNFNRFEISNDDKTTGFNAIVNKKNPLILQALLERGLDPNLIAPDGRTAFDAAAEQGDYINCITILESGLLRGFEDRRLIDFAIFLIRECEIFEKFAPAAFVGEEKLTTQESLINQLKKSKLELLKSGPASAELNILEEAIESVNKEIRATTLTRSRNVKSMSFSRPTIATNKAVIIANKDNISLPLAMIFGDQSLMEIARQRYLETKGIRLEDVLFEPFITIFQDTIPLLFSPENSYQANASRSRATSYDSSMRSRAGTSDSLEKKLPFFTKDLGSFGRYSTIDATQVTATMGADVTTLLAEKPSLVMVAGTGAGKPGLAKGVGAGSAGLRLHHLVEISNEGSESTVNAARADSHPPTPVDNTPPNLAVARNGAPRQVARVITDKSCCVIL